MSISQQDVTDMEQQPDRCTFRTWGNGQYDNRHHFSVVDTQAFGPVMVCVQCGDTYIMGTDYLWHQTGYGWTFREIDDAEVKE